MDKKLFNDGLKTLDSELGRVKRQQLYWNRGHNIDKRKLFLSFNAAMLTLKFLTNEAKKNLKRNTEMTASKIRPEIQMVIDRIKNFDQVVEGIPHVSIKTEESINKGYDPEMTIQISYE